MGEKETRDEATNLNSSKSNRSAESGEDIAIDEEGVQRSAGSSSGSIAIGEEGLQRSAPPGGEPDDPAGVAINGSNSNIKNMRATEDGGGPARDEPESAEGTIVKSKSNITNN